MARGRLGLKLRGDGWPIEAYESVLIPAILWGNLSPQNPKFLPKNTQNTQKWQMHQINPPDMWSPRTKSKIHTAYE